MAEIDETISDVAGAVIIEKAHGIQDRPTGEVGAVRHPVIVLVDVISDGGRIGGVHEEQGARGVLKLGLPVLAAMADRTGRTAAPALARVGVGDHRAKRVGPVAMKFLQ